MAPAHRQLLRERLDGEVGIVGVLGDHGVGSADERVDTRRPGRGHDGRQHDDFEGASEVAELETGGVRHRRQHARGQGEGGDRGGGGPGHADGRRPPPGLSSEDDVEHLQRGRGGDRHGGRGDDDGIARPVRRGRAHPDRSVFRAAPATATRGDVVPSLSATTVVATCRTARGRSPPRAPLRITIEVRSPTGLRVHRSPCRHAADQGGRVLRRRGAVDHLPGGSLVHVGLRSRSACLHVRLSAVRAGRSRCGAEARFSPSPRSEDTIRRERRGCGSRAVAAGGREG